MSYFFSGWKPADDSNTLLGKILNLLGAVAKGDTGFLIRGDVSTAPQQATAAPSSSAIQTTNQTVFTLAAGEIGWVTNLSTSPLFVRKEAAASATAFHYVLPAGYANDDGSAGSILIDDHIGVVSVYSADPRYSAWKVAL